MKPAGPEKLQTRLEVRTRLAVWRAEELRYGGNQNQPKESEGYKGLPGEDKGSTGEASPRVDGDRDEQKRWPIGKDV